MNTALTTKSNRRIALFIATIMALTLWAGFPLQASADSTDTEIDLTDTSKTQGTNWSYNNNVFMINSDANVTITGTTSTSRVQVAENATNVTITLNGVNITSSTEAAGNSPIMLNAGANATIKLQGANILEASWGNRSAALNAPEGTTLTITSASGDGSVEGTLTATKPYDAAKIGGNVGESGGNITINGGTITATDGAYGAGIGGGAGGAGGNITINGGMITATGGISNSSWGGSSGAGIGGGTGGAGGNITINGGTINATGGYIQNGGVQIPGSGIGGGANGASGNITITGGVIAATAGSVESYSSNVAGIGGAVSGAGESITITGGVITANGGASSPAAIGAGNASNAGTITISGTPVITVNNRGIGVVGSGGTVSITDATAYIKGNINVEPTITNSVLLATGTVTNTETNASNGILLSESNVTIDTAKTPIEVTLKENLTVPEGSAFTIPKGVKVIVSSDKTLTIADGADFFLDTGGSIDGAGSFPTTYSGAFVSDIEVTAITNNKITITKPVQTEHSNATQAVEYAISTENTPPTETQDWTETSSSDTIEFTSRAVNKTYYIFARSKAASPYKSGAAKSTEVKTLYPVTVTFDSQGGDEVTVNKIQSKLSTQTVEPVTPETPTKTGYTFDGWYSQQDGYGTKYTLGESGTKLSIDTGVAWTDGSQTAGEITLYAKWTAKPITITYQTDGTSAVGGATIGALGGQIGALATTSKTGYDFVWKNGDTVYSTETVLSEAAGVVLTDGEGNNTLTLTAQWTVRTDIPLTFNANGGTDGSPTSWNDLTFGQTITAKDKTLPAKNTGAPTRTGYTFQGWSTDPGTSNSVNFDESATVNWTSKIVYAVWAAKPITITYAAAGGSDPVGGTTTGTLGGQIGALAATSKTGYSFVWKNGSTVYSATTVLSEAAGVVLTNGEDNNTLTLTADWAAKPVTITYAAAGGSDPSGGTATGTLGGQIGTLATTSKTGYSFVWKNGDTVYSATTVLSEAAGVVLTDGEGNNTLTLTADWTADPVAITYDLNAGDDETAGLTNTPSDTGTYNSAIATFPAATRTGYTLDGWYADEEVTDNEYEDGTAISAGVTYDSGYKLKLYAKWSAKSVAVNYQYNYGTAGVYDTTSGAYDGKIDAAPTAPARAGYTFGGWYKDEAAQNAWTFGEEGMILNTDNGVENADEAEPALSLYAKWTANPPQTYAVTVTGGTGGGSFAAGDKVSITADALSGKIFDRWTGGVDFADAGSPATTFIMPANAVTVTATYKDAPVVAPPGSQIEEEGANIKVTLPDGGGTVVVPPGSTVMPGENKGKIEVTLPGGDIVIVPPGSMVDAEGNVTAPPTPPATENGWVKNENGEWEYLVGGEAKTGWLYDTNYRAWYYLGTNGTMQTGWVYDQKDKAWYYLASNGKMVAGKWLHDTDGRWYYLSGNGEMLTGKQNIGGEVYSFRGNGAWVG